MNILSYLKIATLIISFYPTINFAQQQTSPPLVKTIYYYTFSTENIAAVDVVLNHVKALSGVIESKYEFKPEKHAGQLIVIVQEKTRTSESDVLFQPTDLKRILAENGFSPKVLRSEKIQN